jgi:hypothetical protein|tara:strand:+ start:227 stop:472 length:246 start_codon:yes stop_codon:yes gene_type:complete
MKQTKVVVLLNSVDRERESPPTAAGAATSASRAGRNLSEEELILTLLLSIPSSHQKISIVTQHANKDEREMKRDEEREEED